MKTKMKKGKPLQADSESNAMKSIFNAQNQHPIPMAPIMSQSALRQLQQLYGEQKSNSNADQQNLGILPANSMEAHIRAAQLSERRSNKNKVKADLMNVSLD